MESPAILRQNLAVAKDFQPMSLEEMHQVVAAVKPVSGDGRLEVYKTSLRYDGVVTRQMHEQSLNGAHS
jgi:hypothetical protein